MLLDALEDGCTKRAQFHKHAGEYFIVNNAASELRAAGIPVEWDHATDEYRLLDERHGPDPHPGFLPPVSLVEEPDGQYAMDVAA